MLRQQPRRALKRTRKEKKKWMRSATCHYVLAWFLLESPEERQR